MPKPNKFDGMMHEICVGMGFCGQSLRGLIPASGEVSAEEFIEWVFEAEDMKEIDRMSFRKTLMEIFIKHMGSQEVDASQLHSDYKGA